MSSYYTVKRVLLDRMRAIPELHLTEVEYAFSGEAQFGPGDLIERIWFGDADSDLSLENIRGGAPLQFSEALRLEVLFQVIGQDDSHTQDVTDERCEALVRQVCKVLSTDPKLGIQYDFVYFDVMPSGAVWSTGFVENTPAYGTGCLLTLTVNSRREST